MHSSETFTCNDRGGLLTASGSAGSSSFAYNTDGLMTSRTDAAGTTSYGYDEEAPSCPIPHSFLGSTKVLLADGSSKPISALRVGDRIANSRPGKPGLETHPVDRVIVTETDHDFVDVKVKPSQVRRAVGRAVAGLVVAAAVVTGGAATASAAQATVTTTYHHPFYDVTRGAFVEAVDLQVGDRLQTADGGEATVEEVRPYHSTEVTYDLTIDELHTYYVFAGDTPVLVHNCNTTVYRYQEDPSSMRLSVDEEGNVTHQGNGQLYLNMSGDIGHSQNFRGSAGSIVAFDVPTSYAAEIMESALPQRMPRDFPGSRRDWNMARKSAPEIADTKVSPGLIGLPLGMIEEFMGNIVPGSGRVIGGAG